MSIDRKKDVDQEMVNAAKTLKWAYHDLWKVGHTSPLRPSDEETFLAFSVLDNALTAAEEERDRYRDALTDITDYNGRLHAGDADEMVCIAHQALHATETEGSDEES